MALSAYLPGATLVLREPSRFLLHCILRPRRGSTPSTPGPAQRILCSSTSQLETSRGQDHPASRQSLQKRNNRWQIGAGYKSAEMRPSTCHLPRFLLTASPSRRPGQQLHRSLPPWLGFQAHLQKKRASICCVFQLTVPLHCLEGVTLQIFIRKNEGW